MARQDMTRVRILTVGNMYPPHHLGGYELLWQAGVGALRADGHEVRVLTTDHCEHATSGDDDPDVHRELRWYWRDHDFPRLSLRERYALERHNRRVWERHVAEHRPHTVSWWAMGGMSLALIERARRAGLPATAWVIDDWLHYAPQVDQWTRAWRRWPGVGRVDLPRAARWIFCAEGLRTAALTRYPRLADTAVEPLGVAPVFAEHPPRPWADRLVYVGRIDERKGIGTAVEALVSLPEATLRLVGGGDHAETARLRTLAADLGVAGRVTFDGPVPRERLPAVYAAGDVTVFPVTWAEPFGLVPLEAMAVGRPVIATGQGGSGDYLRDGENALVFAPGDAEALAACVGRLAGDAALRDRLRAGGLQTAARLTEARWLGAVRREHEGLA